MTDESALPNPPVSKKPLTILAKKLFTLFENPLIAGLITFLSLALLTIYLGIWGKTTENNYFSYLADAFMHGQLHLRLQPPTTLDLSIFQGKLYLYWPPLPAVISIPLVLLFGVNFSDVIFTIAIASLNVAIVAQLLRKCNSHNLLDLSSVQRGMLVFTFAFGTAQMPMAIKGTVWETSILLGFTFIGLTYLAVVSTQGWKAFLLAGVFISAALATRFTVALAGLWPAYYLLRQHWTFAWKKKIGYALLGLAPLLLTIGGLGLYNFYRFGSLLDLGYAYHNMSAYFRPEYEQFGDFSLHYVPRNLYYQWIAYPFLTRDPEKIAMGGSLLLLTPVFFGTFWAAKDRAQRPQAAMLVITILLTYARIAIHMSTGYTQLGPRYLLDIMVPLLILTGIGIKFWRTRITGILVAISFLQYLALVLMVCWACAEIYLPK